MYQVQFLATTSADWAEAIELIDADTNLPLDVATATFKLQVDDRDGCGVLTASTEAGTIIQPEPGVVQWHFPLGSMGSLCRGSTYSVGLTMTTADGTTQLFTGTLAIVDGVVGS